MRTELCDEALRVGRILARLAPDEPEVHGLVALMEIQASRSGARTQKDGTPILLLDQDRGKWNQILIRRGLAALDEADVAGRRRRPLCAAGRDRGVSRARSAGLTTPTGSASLRSTTNCRS